jgi:methylated-DNA-[protein]-cysteine S-methyltransferase
VTPASRTVELHAALVEGRWYGLAAAGETVAATAVGPTREKTLGSLRQCLPPGVGWREAVGERTSFVEKTLAMLVALEAGREEGKELPLAEDLVEEPFASILKVASAIPLGYVTTYGDVAKAAGAEAREVGTAMARNPVYPIVPCHRVVGAGFALTGYAGSRAPAALRAKLERLEKEARGFGTERDVPAGAGALHVYPVERAIARARKDEDAATRQRSLFE